MINVLKIILKYHVHYVENNIYFYLSHIYIMTYISNIPIYTIFILILILSGGYIIELIPCRLKKLLTENIFMKHFFCLLTLIFFISITDSSNNDKKLNQIIIHSLLLYIIFMFVIKTQYKFFVAIMILLAIIYLLKIKDDEIKKDIENENNHKKMNIEKYIKLQYTLLKIKNILKIITLILTLIGFSVYLGQKKYEYKDKFSYITFLLGTYKCKNTFNDPSIVKSLQYLFTT